MTSFYADTRIQSSYVSAKVRNLLLSTRYLLKHTDKLSLNAANYASALRSRYARSSFSLSMCATKAARTFGHTQRFRLCHRPDRLDSLPLLFLSLQEINTRPF